MSPLLSRGSGSRRERIRRLVAETPLTPAGELSPGRRAVGGTVVAGETVSGPLTDEACVLVEFEKGRYHEDQYDPVEGSIEAVPFVVQDPTGRVLVDPTDYDYADGPLPISPARTERFEGDESGENVRPVDDEEGPVLPWIHAEASIRPGDEVYVVGEVRRLGAADVALTATDLEADRFVADGEVTAPTPDLDVDALSGGEDPDGPAAGTDGGGTPGTHAGDAPDADAGDVPDADAGDVPDADAGDVPDAGSEAEGPGPVEYVLVPSDDPDTFVVTDLSRMALYEQLDRPSPLSEDFWRSFLLGFILVVILLIVVAIFVGVFVL